MRRNFMRAVAAAIAAPYVGTAASQAAGDRIYRMILSIGPGSGLDTMYRAYAKVLSAELQAPVVVENKPGADGGIAFREFARAGADGRTFMLVSDSMMSLLPQIKPGVYDHKVLRPIVNLTRSTSLIITRADGKYRNLQDLLDAARLKPGSVAFGTYALFYRFTLARLEEATKTRFNDIPYKGTPANALNDLLGGTIDAIFYEASGAIPLIESGRVRALAVLGTERLPAPLATVPTVTESGYPGFSMYLLLGMGIHSGTPEPLARQLEAVAIKAARSPEMIEYAKQRSTQHYVLGSNEFNSIIDKDTVTYKDFVARTGIDKRLAE